MQRIGENVTMRGLTPEIRSRTRQAHTFHREQDTFPGMVWSLCRGIFRALASNYIVDQGRLFIL